MNEGNYKTGWISLYRSIKSSWLWSKEPLSNFEAWVTILMECNHTEKKVLLGNVLINCGRGESLNSLETWSNLFKWNKSATRRFLVLLESDKMIVRKATQKTTHLKVCNYNSYQVLRNTDESIVKRKRNADESELTPNNNVNNSNNENKGDVYRKFAHLSISKNEYLKLEKKWAKKQIDIVLDNIENWANNKSKKSLYLTARNWLTSDYPVKVERDKQGRPIKRNKEGLRLVTDLAGYAIFDKNDKLQYYDDKK